MPVSLQTTQKLCHPHPHPHPSFHNHITFIHTYRIRAEVALERNTGVRYLDQLRLLKSRRLQNARATDIDDDVPPLSDPSLYLERAVSSPNILLTTEIQINPSAARAVAVDEETPPPEGEQKATTIM